MRQSKYKCALQKFCLDTEALVSQVISSATSRCIIIGKIKFIKKKQQNLQNSGTVL